MFKNKYFLLVIMISFFLNSYSQEKFTLSGIISDSKNNETLIGVNVYVPSLKTGITTNEYGFYSITLPKGSYTIVVSNTGYQSKEETIDLNKNTKFNCQLSTSEQVLEEVVIDGIAEEKITTVTELKHNAEDAKKSKEEIDAITEPKKEIIVSAKGVLVL